MKSSRTKYNLSIPLFAAIIIFSSAAIESNKPKSINISTDIQARKKLSINPDTTSADTSMVYTTASVDVMPEYPGGMGEFYSWVGRNYNIPKAAEKVKISGRMFLSFIIEKDGSLSNIHCVRDLKYGTGESAVQLLKSSLKWTPGIQNGQPVRVQFVFPLELNINK